MQTVIKYLSLITLTLFLCGCAPKFEIESKYNEFRNTTECSMRNNRIKKHDASGHLFFDLKKDTEYQKLLGSPYSLSISSTELFLEFKKDSHLRLRLTDANNNTETVLLKGIFSDSIQDKIVHYNPGTFINDTYFPGSVSTRTISLAYVSYTIPKNIAHLIFNATMISFDLETQNKTIHGTLSEENINNIREFFSRCVKN